MAQKSKKDFIVEQATPMFIETGFKATSIDMVVKKTGVSKPTVYNHFSDKSELILAAVERLIVTEKPTIKPVSNLDELVIQFAHGWMTASTIGWYALVIGEGKQFPEAKRRFWSEFDQGWRMAFKKTVSINGFESNQIDDLMDLHLIRQLRNR
jgi:TetR/AcrR family transcriptional regulator, regulator of autoinduction and epiphytic fitness